MAQKVLIGWSGGKDSAMTLYELRRTPDIDVVGLLTTVTEGYNRISMHGVRRTLLEQQAASLGLPLHSVDIPSECANSVYESRMQAALEQWHGRGIETVAFGDLFLEEIRRYRETNLARIGMRGIFPIWGRDTRELMRDFVSLAFRGVIVCVDTAQIPASFAGRMIDEILVSDLPPHADPCGENGEFHSFVFQGPLFRDPVPFEIGEVVTRGQFAYCDLVPAAKSHA
ncbi:MAG: ATP-binding protein [Terriglobia bacterium]